MIQALEKAFPDPSLGVKWTRPQGGLFLWVSLPEGIDTADVLLEAVKEKVAFVPGAPFHPGGDGRNSMRLNFSNASDGADRRGDRAPRARRHASRSAGLQPCGSPVAQGFSPAARPRTLQ